MEFNAKTIGIVALIIGAVFVILLSRGGGGGGIKTIAPLPPADGGDKLSAFSELIGFERDLALGQIQGLTESFRIEQALEAERVQSATQRYIARQQAEAQQSSDFWGFLSQVAGTALPLVL